MSLREKLNDEWENADAHEMETLAFKLIAIVADQAEALELAEYRNAEAINGIVRGFVGNAEADVRKAQEYIRGAIARTSDRHSRCWPRHARWQFRKCRQSQKNELQMQKRAHEKQRANKFS